MNTKKLVLGFCALAAVTVAAPKAFGDVDVVLPSEMLTTAIPDSGKKAAAAMAVSASVKRLKDRTKELAKLGDEEAYCVETAILCNRRAYIFYGIAAHNAALINEKLARIRHDLVKAKRSAERAWNAERAWFIIDKREAEVDKLTLELTEAEQQKKLVSEDGNSFNCVGKGYIDAAEEYRREASALRAKRIAHITAVSENDLSNAIFLKKDIARLSCPDISSADIETIYKSALQYAAIHQEAVSILGDVERTAKRILDAIQWKKDDYDWFRDVIAGSGNCGDYRDFYDKFQASYSQMVRGYDDDDEIRRKKAFGYDYDDYDEELWQKKALGYNYDDEKLVPQITKVLTAFERAKELEEDAGSRL